MFNNDLNCLAISNVTLEKSHELKHHFVTSDWVSDNTDCRFLKNEILYVPKTSENNNDIICI